ncbi:uncharacterized protein LOC120644506 [Panicum virgatum]|uniref:uncharacterized protein LOC120644506 n=1 Tax=Panicum virgatum TaxID=38727 RepID=UPI0019D59A88|nr:uncharacterized protein LOC120644506 [Panicum virgatum]
MKELSNENLENVVCSEETGGSDIGVTRVQDPSGEDGAEVRGVTAAAHSLNAQAIIQVSNMRAGSLGRQEWVSSAEDGKGDRPFGTIRNMKSDPFALWSSSHGLV